MSCTPPNCCRLWHLLHFWLLLLQHTVVLARPTPIFALSNPDKLQDDSCSSLPLAPCTFLLPWSQPLGYILGCVSELRVILQSLEAFLSVTTFGEAGLTGNSWVEAIDDVKHSTLPYTSLDNKELSDLKCQVMRHRTPFLDSIIFKLYSTSNLYLKHFTFWLLLPVFLAYSL